MTAHDLKSQKMRRMTDLQSENTILESPNSNVFQTFGFSEVKRMPRTSIQKGRMTCRSSLAIRAFLLRVTTKNRFFFVSGFSPAKQKPAYRCSSLAKTGSIVQNNDTYFFIASDFVVSQHTSVSITWHRRQQMLLQDRISN